MQASLITSPRSVLGEVLFPGTRTFKSVLLVLGGSFALALSAKIQVPFWPVPITLQSMMVLLIGIASGSRLGALIILAYLAEGALGLPVFAGAAAGPAYLAGPTGGYLLGFLLGATFAGWATERGWGRDLFRTLPVMLLGHFLIVAPGMLWLGVLLGWNKAVAFGIAPFLLATLIKSALGAAMVSVLWKIAAGPRAS